MKKLSFIAIAVIVLQACGNNNNGTTGSAGKTPADAQPPGEAIPESTKIINDSVIQPKSKPASGTVINGGDSSKRK